MDSRIRFAGLPSGVGGAEVWLSAAAARCMNCSLLALFKKEEVKIFTFMPSSRVDAVPFCTDIIAIVSPIRKT